MTSSCRRVQARVALQGNDLTLVGWGNTVGLCRKAADALGRAGASVDVIDVRWLSPWDRAAVLRSVAKTRRLLVVHEDNLSAGFGAEVIATAVEAVGEDLVCKRVARSDTFVPCHFGNQLKALPSFRRTLETAAAMLGLELKWERAVPELAGRHVIHALGSSPAHQTVEIVALPVSVAQSVTAGQTVACLEADKAVVDLASPVDGVVEKFHVRIRDRVPVNTPLMTLVVACQRQRQFLMPSATRFHASRRRRRLRAGSARPRLPLKSLYCKDWAACEAIFAWTTTSSPRCCQVWHRPMVGATASSTARALSRARSRIAGKTPSAWLSTQSDWR